jgi:hypothetical protein
MSELDTTARALAECALKQQAAGHLANAARLLGEARSLSPDELAAVLREHDATSEARAPYQPPYFPVGADSDDPAGPKPVAAHAC